MALELVAVCRDRGASMKLSLFQMSISTSCSSHVMQGPPFMSHQLPNGNRLSHWQLDPISHSPRQWLCIVVLSSSFSSLHRWNGWQWCRTSHIHNCNHANIPNAHTPCCQLASIILPVCSSSHRGNLVASVALDLLCDRAYSFAHQDKSSWAAVSCSLAIERVQSQTELLRWLWLKKVGRFPRQDEANE